MLRSLRHKRLASRKSPGVEELEAQASRKNPGVEELESEAVCVSEESKC